MNGCSLQSYVNGVTQGDHKPFTFPHESARALPRQKGDCRKKSFGARCSCGLSLEVLYLHEQPLGVKTSRKLAMTVLARSHENLKIACSRPNRVARPSARLEMRQSGGGAKRTSPANMRI